MLRAMKKENSNVMVLKTTANNALIMYSGVIKNSVPL
jgi:hypothetical protein